MRLTVLIILSREPARPADFHVDRRVLLLLCPVVIRRESGFVYRFWGEEPHLTPTGTDPDQPQVRAGSPGERQRDTARRISTQGTRQGTTP